MVTPKTPHVGHLCNKNKWSIKKLNINREREIMARFHNDASIDGEAVQMQGCECDGNTDRRISSP
jgi:hypothetical protein